MASPETVEKVRAAILATYRDRDVATRATNAELIAAAGVSHKSFYRVKQDHPEIVTLLADVEAVFLGRPVSPEEDESADPLKRNPRAAAEELLSVVAALTDVVEQQKVRIRDLERALAYATDPGFADYPAPPDLAIARARRSRRDRSSGP
ncbi:hypothetical protein [Nocardioides jejuensis]|uniref:Uncharacterized protein n=1 Tax=Nocardioides jejuensis TaxID=2502782 RepID=A0A4R1BWI9_9ACTN|nr:hypothetical protein [Nocardioides jejuensis]TCJ21645.1 hypothetical protein EPD65_14550 [Nocardioides jejuensis]